MSSVSFTAFGEFPEIDCGTDLAATIAECAARSGFVAAAHDVFIVAQKIVSKAEGRTVDLNRVLPSGEAQRLAETTGKDPRFVEVVLSESSAVVRAAPNVLITRHRAGFVMANAGVDRSNVPSATGQEIVLLLPEDPDASAAELCRRLQALWHISIGVIISDSFGRPWRNGVVNVALGVAGLPALVDCRGEHDRNGRRLEMTEIAFADAIAAGAALAMGEAAEGRPVVVARGLQWNARASNGAALLRPLSQDLFK